MTWRKTPADRRKDAKTYRDPEYVRNRAAVLRRAGGRCEECGRRDRPLQVDHVVAVSAGGGHDLGNLRALCSGAGSCHARKTAQEGKGYRRRGGSSRDPAPRPRTRWT